MSKTVLEVGEMVAGAALAATGFGAIALPWVISAQVLSTMASIGIAVGLAGTFGLLQSVLNPTNTSVTGSQQNESNSAAYRRICYGNVEVGGVLTYDSTPAGNHNFQNPSDQFDWRHQIYTVAGHQITAFGRAGVMAVVIANVYTKLVQDPSGSGYWVPEDTNNPWGANSGGESHIAFEFDLGNPNSGPAFPLLAQACPDWKSGFSEQRGCAKVHVAMRYDLFADGQHMGGGSGQSHLVSSVPIYVSGEVPTFRFPLTGKPLLDTRQQVTQGSTPTWQPSTPFTYAGYVIDQNNNVEVMLSKGVLGQTFVSGTQDPAWGAVGTVVADDYECAWLNAGPIQPGLWPGPNQTIPSPYVFRDANGNLQLLAGTGVTGAQGHGNIVYQGDGYVTVESDAPIGFGAEFSLETEQQDEGKGLRITGVDVDPVGQGYVGAFGLTFVGHGQVIVNGSGTAEAGESEFTTGPNEPPLAGTPGQFAPDNGNFWTCLGTPSGYGFSTNPSNNALAIYDFLTDTDYGLHVDPSRINIEEVSAAANICEEQLTVYWGANNGIVQENRYSCDGLFDQSQARGDILKALCASMAGCVVPPGDQWHVQAGAYQPPTYAITDADLRGPIKGDFRISKRDICNGVRGKFLPSFLPTNTTENQPAAWHWTDFPPYQANGLNHTPDWLAEDGGQSIWKDVTFTFTASIWAAQRLAKIIVQTLRHQVTLHLPCKLTPFQVRAGDTVTFVHTRWAGLAEPPPTTFFVSQATPIIEIEDGSPVLGVDLVLRETSEDVYDFTAPLSAADQGEYSWYGSLGTIQGG